jgi:hypothetical protein
MEYSTPGHGGYRLSPSVDVLVPGPLRELGKVGRHTGWYEEDLCYAVVHFCFPALFSAEQVENARDVLKNWYPDAYMAATGEWLEEKDSRVLRERALRATLKDKYVGVTAWGDWHDKVPAGMVAVRCVKGGRDERGGFVTNDEKHLLVPEPDYAKSGPLGFVVEDPAKYTEVVGGL